MKYPIWKKVLILGFQLVPESMPLMNVFRKYIIEKSIISKYPNLGKTQNGVYNFFLKACGSCMFYGSAKQTAAGLFCYCKMWGDHSKSSLFLLVQEGKAKKCCRSIHIYIICLRLFPHFILSPPFTPTPTSAMHGI